MYIQFFLIIEAISISLPGFQTRTKFSIGSANRVDDRIYRITDHSINALNASINHHLRDLISCCFWHRYFPFFSISLLVWFATPFHNG